MPLWANIFVHSHSECGTESVSIRFYWVSLIFQKCKSDANKQDFEFKLILTSQFNPPQTIGTSTKLFCTSGPNLAVLPWTGDELLHGKAQNGVNFGFEIKFHLEGQSQSPHKTIGILTEVVYSYGPNLVILAWTGDELSYGQTWWSKDGQTVQATTIPGGQYWPRATKWN